ncbi:MAG: type II toxin-antitoxin system death-on-curing family toxin [Chlamydiota bacterium]
MADFYLTVAEVLTIHDQLIDEFGGKPGILDRGRLEAAVFRPQIGYYSSLAEEAAALMESLANNNPFMDGNKRTSFAAADTFLRLNGFCLEVQSLEAYDFITQAIAAGSFTFSVIRDWISAHVQRL